jgi:hypothetical protein
MKNQLSHARMDIGVAMLTANTLSQLQTQNILKISTQPVSVHDSRAERASTPPFKDFQVFKKGCYWVTLAQKHIPTIKGLTSVQNRIAMSSVS